MKPEQVHAQQSKYTVLNVVLILPTDYCNSLDDRCVAGWQVTRSFAMSPLIALCSDQMEQVTSGIIEMRMYLLTIGHDAEEETVTRVTGYDTIVRNQEQENGRFFRLGVVPNGKF
jgi:hypothetical protein